MLKIIPRHQLDATVWDACVAASPQRLVYGYSWYLDTVLPAPDWKWVGIVLTDQSGAYRAVMPIPLRRKTIRGLPYKWVVHQPFFCQFLDIFSADKSLKPAPFFQLMTEQFQYGSVFCTRRQPDSLIRFDALQTQTTHILDLSVRYQTLYQNYSRDRKVNLRRAQAANWTIVDSTNPEPLLTLFRENHAEAMDGGVANWAYDIFRNLTKELTKRGFGVLRYAMHNDRIEAGALFVREGNRLVYLFNAASETGRRGNARTLLIDQFVREWAEKPLIFDFESPEKQSIRDFYQSFGATQESFRAMRWNRLTKLERVLQHVMRSYAGNFPKV